MNRSTRRLVSYSALALSMSMWACGGDDGTSSSGGGGTGNVGATGGSGGTGGGIGGGGTGGGTGGGGTGGIGGGGTGGGGTGGIAGSGGVAGGGTGGTGGGGTDADGDGYDSSKDCDDTNKDINPGATEICNGVDDDCDTQTDEGVTTTFYADGDGDNYGVDNATTNKQDCSAPTGYASAKDDCDDKDATVYPGNTEVCDGKDNDCKNGVDDGVTKNSYYNDTDGDGYGAGTATQACTPPGTTWVTQGGDCNDADKAMFPGNPEVCDGKDNDCDNTTADPGSQTWYLDGDGDGFGLQSSTKTGCTQPTGYVAATTVFDCNDADKAINPQAIELCDGKDNNCVNGVDEGPTATWPDADGDGFGDSKATATYLCNVPSGRADNNGDCNDANKAINPSATEIPGNSIDENCDGKDTAAGTSCGNDSLAASTIPYVDNFNSLSTSDASTGSPAGAGFYWDDWEISTTAGQTFTILYGQRNAATFLPRMYHRVGCSGGFITTNPDIWTENPNGNDYRARRVITNSVAGYYFNPVTTMTAGQTGAYSYAVYPGNVGGTCGSDQYTFWPMGKRVSTTLSTTDTETGSPVGAGYYADDHEFWATSGTTYTILQGGSSFTDRFYVSAGTTCGTSVGTASSGINNNGARLVFTPTTTGIHTLWTSSLFSGSTGSYQANVVQGNVGESCFTGTAPAGGTGDAYVLWPLGGTVNQSLAIGDRIGDMLTSRFHDDYETYLEYGDTINVTVTRTSGSTWTPRVFLTRAGACTSIVAQSAQVTGTVGTLTYAVPSTGAGIYTIVVTSSATSGTGNYSIATTY